MKKLVSTLLLLSAATAVSAQWSEDPAVNNRITPSNVGFYEPTVRTNSDGVTYYFYLAPTILANGNDAFQHRMQIYTAEGKRVYGAAGKILTQERNITWTKYCDYTVLDNDGNCLVAAYDLRDSDPAKYDFNYYIYKIAPTGEQLWGPVALNNGQADANTLFLRMCATDDGGTAYVYCTSSTDGKYRVTQLERLDKDGHPLWQQPVVIEPESETTRPFVVNNGENEVMVIYQDATGEFVARVFDAQGNDVWKESIVLYSGGFSSQYVFPSIDVQAGPGGGVIFCVMNGAYDGLIVYLTRDGQYGFPDGNYGTRVPGPDYQSTVPNVCYQPEEQAFYVAFNNMAYYGYDGYGVSVQKFSLEGEPLWGDNGVEILPTQPDQQVSTPTMRLAPDGRMAVFYQYMEGNTSTAPVSSFIAIVDKDGQVVVEPQDFSTTLNVKKNFSVSPLIGGNHYIASWTERRTGSTSECIYSQYVNALDGSTTNGIETIATTDDRQADALWTLDGNRHQQPAKGLNIVRRGGKTTKFINK